MPSRFLPGNGAVIEFVPSRTGSTWRRLRKMFASTNLPPLRAVQEGSKCRNALWRMCSGTRRMWKKRSVAKEKYSWRSVEGGRKKEHKV